MEIKSEIQAAEIVQIIFEMCANYTSEMLRSKSQLAGYVLLTIDIYNRVRHLSHPIFNDGYPNIFKTPTGDFEIIINDIKPNLNSNVIKILPRTDANILPNLTIVRKVNNERP